MSITLKAYPMGFLIAPEEARKNKPEKASDKTFQVNPESDQRLRSIKVLTNLTAQEFVGILRGVNFKQIRPDVIALDSGLQVRYQARGKFVTVDLFGLSDTNDLQNFGEEFFKSLDNSAQRNVRLIDSKEYFYYYYATSYTDIKDIYNQLKSKGATQIFSSPNAEIVANLNNQKIKYFKYDNEKTYTLEMEQEVRILNIGMKDDFEGRNVTYGLKDLKIQTNIKPNELKQLLHSANYLLYFGNNQTPLKSSDAVLNWVLKDGFYCAEFSGSNNSAIEKEAEILFRKLNKIAGRDLRYINDVSTTVYTYTTNYTDKGVLLNTLTEHGAEDISEQDGEISCKLFGMQMIYYKKNNSEGYTLDITQITNKSECEGLINDLNDEYGLNIQEITYNKIKERLDSENMRLESETVMDDNSIVLTIEV